MSKEDVVDLGAGGDDDLVEEEVEAAAREASKVRGRGGGDDDAKGDGEESRARYGNAKYDSVPKSQGQPQKSVEGWVLIVRGVHKEAQEDDIRDLFAEYGEIRNLHLNLDRRTGFVKGYALLEYKEEAEAKAAVAEMNGKKYRGAPLAVDWAFVSDPRSKQ